MTMTTAAASKPAPNFPHSSSKFVSMAQARLRRRWLKSSTALVVIIGASVVGVCSAHAQTFIYLGGSASWNSPTSWDMAFVPNSATAQVILPSPTGNSLINLSGGAYLLNSLTYQGGSAALYGISGGILRFDGAGATIDVQSTTPAFQRVHTGMGPTTIEAVTDLTVNTVAGGGLLLEPGVTLTGAGGLIKTGAGTLQLQTTNSYAGGTTVEAGILQTGAVDALGTGPLTVNGGTLDLNGFNQTVGTLSGAGGTISLGSATLTTLVSGSAYAGVISGTGSLVHTGPGTLTLTGSNTFTGGTTVTNGGAIFLVGTGSLAANGAVTLSNAGVYFDISGASGARSIGTLSGVNGSSVILGFNTLTLGGTGDSTFAGTISGGGGIVKQGSGTQTLNAAQGYSGGTIINAGTLALGPSGLLGFVGAVSLAASGTAFDVSATGQQIVGSLSGVAGSSLVLGANPFFFGHNATNQTFAGQISGPGSIVKQGAGTQTLTGASSYGGGTELQAGALNLGNSGALGSGVLTVTGASGLTGAAGVAVGNDIALNNTLNFGAGGGALTLNGGISGLGGMSLAGAPGLTLNGANTFSGGFNVGGGALVVGNDLALGFGAVTVSGASSLDANASVSLGNNFNLNASLGIGGSNNLTLNGAIGGLASITKNGAASLTLGGVNTFSGGVTINSGTLLVEGSLANGAVSVASGARLGGSGSIGGVVTVADGGTLAPGSSPGTLTVGSLTLNPTSQLAYELGTPGVVGGGVNDLTIVTGSLTLDGVLNIAPQAGFGTGTYRLFDYGSMPSNNGLAFGIVPAGYDLSVDLTTPGEVNLVTSYTGLQFWNGAQTTPDGTFHGGAGAWDAATTNWTNQTGNASAAWGNLTAVFSGPAGGTVGLASNQQIAGLQFATDGYVLNGPGALQIAAASTELRIDPGLTATINAVIEGTGGLTKTGGGTIVLGGTNTYTGGTSINAGTLSISANANLGDAAGSLSFNGGTLATTASFGMFRPVTLAGAGNVDVAASTQLELDGPISGGGSLTKLGAGTLVLSGFNTHGGGTTVSAGILQAGSADALGSGALMLDGGTFKAGTSVINSFANAIKVNARGGTIDVNGQVMTLSGGISDGSGAGGALAFVNGDSDIGAVELGGTNGQSGPTSIGTGVTLIALSDGAFSPNSDVTLAATGALMANGRSTTVRSLSGSGIIVNGNTAQAGSLTIALPSGTTSFAGTLSDGEPGDAPLALTKAGAGTQVLTGENSYTGGTTISGGTLQLGAGGTSGSITGNVANNGTLAFNRSDAFTFSGVISGSGSLVQLGSGTVTLTGANSYSGGTTISAGTLIGSATSFGSGSILNNAALIIDQPSDAIFANAIDGTGSLVKRGTGALNLTGTSGLSGQTTVAAGRLAVNGTLANSAVTVLAGATLGGNGTVGATTIQAGATIAPGNSIGTLNVNGNLTLAQGSIYEVEIAGNGGSDRIAVTGIATVTGSQVGISALDPQTSYINGQRYTILTATGGVSGSAPSAVSRSAFLDLSVDQQPNEVGLVIQVKGTPTPPVTPPAVFQSAAQTRNQFATALALNTLPQVGGTLALYNSLLVLDAPTARAAFDALSGDTHASAKTALVEESWLLRNAMNDRLRSAFGSVGSASMATMNYGFTADLAPAVKGPMPRLNTERFAVWGHGFGGWGRSEAQAGIAKLTRSTGGLMIGADVGVFDALRFGLLAGYSHSEFDVKGRLSSGESDNYHLGLYGGGQFGALGLRTGASYTWHDISTRRTVAFAGFGDGLQSDYNAGTAQVFGELGYRIDLGRAAFEPFAGLAYVNLHTGGFREIGGAAALSGRSDDTSIGYSTLGLRASTNLAVQGMDLTARGGLAWRHAFGDVDPLATLAFAGSNAFTIAGVPIAKNAALVEAGVDLAISRSATLGVSYTGQLASDAQDHAFKANLAVKF